MAGEPSLDNYDTGGGATSTTRSPASIGQVYWQPFKNRSEEVAYFLGVPETPGVKPFYTFDEADGYFYSTILTDPNLREQYRQRFVKAGFKIDTNQDLLKAWQTATGWASDSYLKGGRKLTPWDAIDELGASNGGASEANRFKTTTIENVNDTNVKVDLSSAQTARAYLEAQMVNTVGRAPTNDEIANFREALNQMEQANAVVSRTTGTRTNARQGTESTDASGTTTNITGGYSSDNTSTVQTGGMQRDQYALDFARSADDYAEYQAETTFMNALLSAIQSPVDI